MPCCICFRENVDLRIEMVRVVSFPKRVKLSYVVLLFALVSSFFTLNCEILPFFCGLVVRDVTTLNRIIHFFLIP